MNHDVVRSWDERRDLAILNDTKETIDFAADHWIALAKRSIQHRGRFAVALSGGSTPRAIYEKVTQATDIDWNLVWLFWSDERAVAPDHPESNYRMAMESGFKKIAIPLNQIFRMKTEDPFDAHAREYEELIQHHLGKHCFDLVMLGIGEDGHTASLFPDTKALLEEKRLVVSNWVPHLNAHRMTLTFPCINQSDQSAIYALGSQKGPIVSKALEAAIISPWPASRVGTAESKALWILDKQAAPFIIQ